MMYFVAFLPLVVWGVGDNAGDDTEDIICFSGFEKRVVDAVVEDDEDPDQKASRGDSQSQSQQIRYLQAEIGQNPESQIWHN